MDWARASGMEGIKSLWSMEAGTYGCGWLTDVLVPFVLSLYQPFSICSPTLTSLSPAPLALHLLSPSFSSVTITWNRWIQFLQTLGSRLSALGSEGKASMNLFINDDHFPTEKKVLELKHKCIDSIFLVIHCRCSAVVFITHYSSQPLCQQLESCDSGCRSQVSCFFEMLPNSLFPLPNVGLMGTISLKLVKMQIELTAKLSHQMSFSTSRDAIEYVERHQRWARVTKCFSVLSPPLPAE